ncbi:MAG: beta-galactosidase [Thermoguttaceae bacterium]|nr:beta-galactosidase [Thermoguttaceae bacterium]MDW8079200.1 beta-galactosidase [Thermoguttaceae bacterium]
MPRRCRKHAFYHVSSRRQSTSLLAAGLFAGWVLLGGSLTLFPAAIAQEEIVLFDPANWEDVSALKITGGKGQWVASQAVATVDGIPGQPGSGRMWTLSQKRLVLSSTGPACTFTVLPDKEPWDFSAYRYLAVELRNASGQPVRVQLLARSASPKGRTLGRQIRLESGESYLLRLTLRRIVPSHLEGKFFGMRGFPALMDPERGIDVSRITEVAVSLRQSDPDAKLEVGKIFVYEAAPQPTWLKRKDVDIFPILDRFGQYIHGEWPGKIQSEEDLKRQRELEEEDLRQNPGSSDWDTYGGWLKGPTFQATGHFYPVKHQGKWWLVDPEGRLFWSHGVDCVRATTATTPLTDRLHYFAELPPRQGPFAAFYGRASWAPHGYYQGKGTYETFCFSGANLLRKYGPEWETVHAALAHRRLRSWGLNTIGNWSGPEVYTLRQTPYVVTLGSGRRPIEGSSGYWGKFPDPFDAEFVAPLEKAMTREANASGQDPWCVGYFVDNELSWGDELALGLATLQSPAEQPAKRVFVDLLQQKYGSIEALNGAWGSSYSSWEELLQSTKGPDRARAKEDLGEFTYRIAAEYFRRIREVLKKYAPNKLYLGCRFAWVNERAIRAAAEFCDVVSFNRYDIDLVDFRLPEGIDRPVIIGEFHFGALDRGMFHTGLQESATQAERAEAYRRYVTSALVHPAIVGTHWFQYQDQATTGRGDGENYQIGFVDVCDTPYPELRSAARFIGQKMYELRLGK